MLDSSACSSELSPKKNCVENLDTKKFDSDFHALAGRMEQNNTPDTLRFGILNDRTLLKSFEKGELSVPSFFWNLLHTLNLQMDVCEQMK